MPWWLVLLILAVLGTFAWGGVLAAPFLPLPRREIDRMLALARPRPGEVLCDLGSGDGRVLIRAAERYGAVGQGYEVALLPYLVCQGRIWLGGKRHIIRVAYRNFFRQPLQGTGVVTAFLTPRAMQQLAVKLERELASGSRVVSYAFPIPRWAPVAVDKPTPRQTAIYLYRIGEHRTKT